MAKPKNFQIVFGLPMFIGEVSFVSFRNDEAAVIMKALKELTGQITTINFKKKLCRNPIKINIISLKCL